jgi:hypothetical protein
MTARRFNRQNQAAPELALAQGPMPMSCLGGEIVDEAMLLDGYDAHLQLLENRPKTTADTYRSHVKGFLRYLATTAGNGASSAQLGRKASGSTSAPTFAHVAPVRAGGSQGRSRVFHGRRT